MIIYQICANDPGNKAENLAENQTESAASDSNDPIKLVRIFMEITLIELTRGDAENYTGKHPSMEKGTHEQHCS